MSNRATNLFILKWIVHIHSIIKSVFISSITIKRCITLFLLLIHSIFIQFSHYICSCITHFFITSHIIFDKALSPTIVIIILIHHRLRLIILLSLTKRLFLLSINIIIALVFIKFRYRGHQIVYLVWRQLLLLLLLLLNLLVLII